MKIATILCFIFLCQISFAQDCPHYVRNLIKNNKWVYGVLESSANNMYTAKSRLETARGYAQNRNWSSNQSGIYEYIREGNSYINGVALAYYNLDTELTKIGRLLRDHEKLALCSGPALDILLPILAQVRSFHKALYPLYNTLYSFNNRIYSSSDDMSESVDNCLYNHIGDLRDWYNLATPLWYRWNELSRL